MLKSSYAGYWNFSRIGDLKEASKESYWGMDQSKLKICRMYSVVWLVKLTFELYFHVSLILLLKWYLFSMLLFWVDQKADQEPDTNERIPGSE